MTMQVSPDGPTFDVQVDGFSHKLPVLTAAVFAKLASFQVPHHHVGACLTCLWPPGPLCLSATHYCCLALEEMSLTMLWVPASAD